MAISADSKRRGWRQCAIGMTLDFMLIRGLNGLSASLRLSKPLLIALTFAPIPAALWAMRGWLKVVRSKDELQLISESMQWAPGLSAVPTFSYGLLETFADLPRLSMTAVLLLMSVIFVLGHALAGRRYR